MRPLSLPSSLPCLLSASRELTPASPSCAPCSRRPRPARPRRRAPLCDERPDVPQARPAGPHVAPLVPPRHLARPHRRPRRPQEAVVGHDGHLHLGPLHDGGGLVRPLQPRDQRCRVRPFPPRQLSPSSRLTFDVQQVPHRGVVAIRAGHGGPRLCERESGSPGASLLLLAASLRPTDSTCTLQGIVAKVSRSESAPDLSLRSPLTSPSSFPSSSLAPHLHRAIV